jgi:hypothetical protein
MRSRHPVLFLLTVLTPFFGCTYKAEPADGKQGCAAGPKQCPDGYLCGLDNFCYHSGVSLAQGGSAGGVAGINGAGGFVGGGGLIIGASAVGGMVTKIGTGGMGAAGGIVTIIGAGGTPSYTSIVRVDGGVGGSGGSTARKFDAGAASLHVATFLYGEATGPITGFGWIALGALDWVTDPTCGYYGAPIMKTEPCSDTTNWNSPTALCISATIPALPAMPIQADYDSNWGIQIGVNATMTPGEPIGRAYSTIAMSFSGSPIAGLRVELHRAGDSDATTYCATNTGLAMKLTSFNTACWDGSGTAFAATDAPLIDKIGVQVSSTATAISVANLCLNSITFGD